MRVKIQDFMSDWILIRTLTLTIWYFHTSSHTSRDVFRKKKLRERFTMRIDAPITLFRNDSYVGFSEFFRFYFRCFFFHITFPS